MPQSQQQRAETELRGDSGTLAAVVVVHRLLELVQVH